MLGLFYCMVPLKVLKHFSRKLELLMVLMSCLQPLLVNAQLPLRTRTCISCFSCQFMTLINGFLFKSKLIEQLLDCDGRQRRWRLSSQLIYYALKRSACSALKSTLYLTITFSVKFVVLSNRGVEYWYGGFINILFMARRI